MINWSFLNAGVRVTVLQRLFAVIGMLAVCVPLQVVAAERAAPTIDMFSSELQVQTLGTISVDVYPLSALEEVPWLWAESLPRGAVLRDSLEGYRVFEWTPQTDQAGLYTIRLIAADAIDTSLRSDMRFTVSVIGEVDESFTPQVRVPDIVEVLAGQQVSFTVNAARPLGVVPGLLANNMPQGAQFTDNGDTTRQFQWQTDDADLGTHSVIFSAIDPRTLRSSLQTVDIIVKSPALAFLDMQALSTEDGYKLLGSTNPYDHFGQSVSTAGDINGDGLADVIISAPGADRRDGGTGLAVGAAYVVFGAEQAPGESIDVSELNGVNGFAIEGSDIQLGDAVGHAGDINGDGIDDVIVGEPYNTFGVSTGRVHVIYGRSETAGDMFPRSIDVNTLDGVIGFTLHGLGDDDALGIYVDAAGDFNNDGVDDMILGSPQGHFGESKPGRAYVIYGRSEGFPASWSVVDLDGSNGFEIVGSINNDRLGSAISGIGDVNADGIDDVIISKGGDNLDGSEDTELRAHVLFGQDTRVDGDFPASFYITEINGSNGFSIGSGNRFQQQSGPMNVSGGVDLNDDGIDDIVLGESWYHAEDARYVGQVLVVYGRDTSLDGDFPFKVDVPSLTGTDGFRVTGSEQLMGLGTAVSGLQDFNGDGVGDLVAKTTNSNRTYVLYGQANGANSEIPTQISEIDQANGLVLINVSDTLTNSFSHRISDAGDVNGDGIGDLIIGAPNGYPGSEEGGEVYIVYGTTSSRR